MQENAFDTGSVDRYLKKEPSVQWNSAVNVEQAFTREAPLEVNPRQALSLSRGNEYIEVYEDLYVYICGSAHRVPYTHIVTCVYVTRTRVYVF